MESPKEAVVFISFDECVYQACLLLDLFPQYPEMLFFCVGGAYQYI